MSTRFIVYLIFMFLALCVLNVLADNAGTPEEHKLCHYTRTC